MISDNSKAGPWPDRLEVDDTVEFEGSEWQVVGTGPGSATLEREGDNSELTITRWAITNDVGFMLEKSEAQNEFGERVTKHD